LASRRKEVDDEKRRSMKMVEEMMKKTRTINLDFFPLRGWL
jgi:hypothetical protein